MPWPPACTDPLLRTHTHTRLFSWPWRYVTAYCISHFRKATIVVASCSSDRTHTRKHSPGQRVYAVITRLETEQLCSASIRAVHTHTHTHFCQPSLSCCNHILKRQPFHNECSGGQFELRLDDSSEGENRSRRRDRHALSL